MKAIGDWWSGRLFRFVHTRNLVYNTCWEDPRLDRQALELRPSDRVLMITSAGCNALDYALAGPERIDTVDVNPRQNALLELKLAGIRRLEFEEFFAMFGRGRLPGARAVYQHRLRRELSEWSRGYWDRWIRIFDDPQRTFYYRGAAGAFAQIVKFYIDRVLKARDAVSELFEASDLDEQRRIYEQLRCRFWTRPLRFFLSRDVTLSMVGVPRAQRRQVELHYSDGVVQFVRDCLDAVFGQLPLADNYFWRVYLEGSYTPTCCPEYLKPDNFRRLQSGLVERIHVTTDSVQGFLEKQDRTVSRFVLLDHMDWLADNCLPALVAEWNAIVRRAAPDSRIIWRSGGLDTRFLDPLQVSSNGKQQPLSELLHYHRRWAATLHAQDRVHTYGSFCIADLRT